MNAKPLRVLHLTFNMGIGGTEQVIRQLITSIGKQSGIESEILCIDGIVGPIGKALEQNGIVVHKVARKQGFDWSLVVAIRTRLKEGRFDIVHCHQYTPWIYGWLATRLTSAKVVFTEHGRFYPDRYRCKAAIINPIIALSTPSIIAISSATRGALARYEFIPKKKINIIYNGIAPLVPDHSSIPLLRKKLGIPSDAIVVGTVSRLDPVKNQPMMLRAFKQLLNNNPASWLLVVGDGPSRTALEKLAEDLGIAKRVSFTGFISSPVNHLTLMKVFLLSSFTEGTSMTLLEAMSLGIPIVATDVGGNSEVIENQGPGILVPNDDADSFCNAISILLNNNRIYVQKSEAARSTFEERFSSKTMAKQYVDVYRDNKRVLADV